jgi:hypothetical protein
VRKPVVYISGPYSAPDPIENIRKALLVADTLLAYNCAPLVPHLTAFWHLLSPKSYEEWLEIDHDHVAVCDALYRFPGESPGADREMEYARKLGIPVFTDGRKIVDFLNEWSG